MFRITTLAHDESREADACSASVSSRLFDKEALVPRILCIALGCLGALTMGCGDSLSLAPASGTVTYKGQPVEGASVTFVQTGHIGTGTTDSAGKFTISTNGKPGAVVGKNGVMISKSVTTISEMPANPKPEDMMKMMSGAKGRPAPVGKAELPKQYGTVEGSGLVAEVTTDAAKNEFTFDLKD